MSAPKKARPPKHHLEAVIVGRIVAAGDHDAAVHVELGLGIIEHRRRPEADADDVDAAFGQARGPAPPPCTGELARPSRPTATLRAAAAPDQGAEAAPDRIGVVLAQRLRRRSRECHIRAGEVGWKMMAHRQAPFRAMPAAVQLGEQRVARRIDPGGELGRAAGVGMDPGDQPPVRRADLVEVGAVARGRAASRASARPHRATAAPMPRRHQSVDHAGEHEAEEQLERCSPSARHRRLARRARRRPARAGPKPAIISRKLLPRGDMGEADLADLAAGRAGSGPWGRARGR